MNGWEFLAQCPRLAFGLSVWWGLIAVVVAQAVARGKS